MGVKFKDLFLQIIFSLFAAHISTIINLSIGIGEIFSSEYYWPFLGGNFFIALSLTLYVRFVSMRTFRRFNVQQDSIKRLILLVLLGLLLPVVISLVLVTLFFKLYDLDVFQNGYLKEDYPFLVCVLLVANFYYLAISKLKKLKSPGTARKFAVFEKEPAIIIDEPVTETSSQELKVPREVIVVDTPTKSIPIRTENIAYSYILGRYVFIRTNDMQSLSESYQISSSLKLMEENLDKQMFFRINRRMIVNFNACKYYRPGKNKTLEVILEPEPYDKGSKRPAEHERLCVVSEDRVSSFKLWMNR